MSPGDGAITQLGNFGLMAMPALAESNPLEAPLSQEVLEAIPAKVRTAVAQTARYASAQILRVAMKQLLPSEERAEVALLNQVEMCRDQVKSVAQLRKFLRQ